MYEKSYLGTVSDLKLNSTYAAILFDSKIHLHLVRGSIFKICFCYHLFLYRWILLPRRMKWWEKNAKL